MAAPILGFVRAGLGADRPYANPPGVLGLEHTAGFDGWTTEMRPPATIQTSHLDSLLITLGAISLLVVAIASINLLVLVLSRVTATRRPHAVRAALGATPLRLAGRRLADGLRLTGVGLGLGLLLALGVTALLRASWPDGLPRWPAFGLDPVAYLFAAGIPTAAVLLAELSDGTVTRHASQVRHLTGAWSTAGPTEGRLRRDLVVFALAGTAALLTNAALLAVATAPATPSDGDMDASDVWIVSLDLQHLGVAHRRSVQSGLVAGFESAAHVESASVAAPGAWAGLGVLDRDLVECVWCRFDGAYVPMPLAELQHIVVGPDYFSTLGVRVRSGRGFDAGDGPTAAHVAIIDLTLASHFPADPIGRHIQIGGLAGEWYRIVGVVDDRRASGIGTAGAPRPTLYVSATQHPPRVARMLVRTDGRLPSDSLEAGLLHLAAAANRLAPELVPLEGPLHAFAAPLRWLSALFVALAALAALLAGVAVHGVMSFSVTQRTRELGVRLALGTRPATVHRLVTGEGMRLMATGTAIGFLAALGIARYLGQRFPGVEPLDLRVYGAVALLLGGAAFVASWRPARRAARLDPIVSLRAD